MRLFILMVSFVFISCKNNDEKLIKLKEKELSLKEKELKLKEIELNISNDSNNTFQDSKITPVTNNLKIYTPEELFKTWEQTLIIRGIFDYVNTQDCNNRTKMLKLYDKGKYPMHTISKSVLDFKYNNDDIKDYVINYQLENCVEGNGWSSDFIILTSENNELKINEKLTNKLKTIYFNYVERNFGSDSYVYKEKNFIVTKSLKINMISNNEVYGEFQLLRDGSSCCPEISGNFYYNIKDNTFNTSNISKNSQ